MLYEKASANLDAIARVLRRVLAKYDPTTEDVVLCCEAGPTGFVPARRLRALGFECKAEAIAKRQHVGRHLNPFKPERQQFWSNRPALSR